MTPVVYLTKNLAEGWPDSPAPGKLSDLAFHDDGAGSWEFWATGRPAPAVNCTRGLFLWFDDMVFSWTLTINRSCFYRPGAKERAISPERLLCLVFGCWKDSVGSHFGSRLLFILDSGVSLGILLVTVCGIGVEGAQWSFGFWRALGCASRRE